MPMKTAWIAAILLALCFAAPGRAQDRLPSAQQFVDQQAQSHITDAQLLELQGKYEDAYVKWLMAWRWRDVLPQLRMKAGLKRWITVAAPH